MPQLWNKRLLWAQVMFHNIYLEGATEENFSLSSSHSLPWCCFKTPQATFEYNSCLKFPTSNLIVSAVNRHLSLCNSFASFMVVSCIQSSQKGPIQTFATIKEVKPPWFKSPLSSGLISWVSSSPFIHTGFLNFLSYLRTLLIKPFYTKRLSILSWCLCETDCRGDTSLCFWQEIRDALETKAFPEDRHGGSNGGKSVAAWLMRKVTGLRNKKGWMMSSVWVVSVGQSWFDPQWSGL